MKVRFTVTARLEIEEILAQISRDNPSAAATVGAAIRSAIFRLRSFPNIGAETDQEGIRIQLARPYQYLIFYRCVGDELVIRNVRHSARRRPPNSRS